MKIAVPTTQNNMVDAHFGHCEFFTVFTVTDNSIVQMETVQSPENCGCKSNIAVTLNEMGVKVMLAGNMGGGAVNVLNSQGIEVYRGCEGNVKELVEEYLKGSVDDSGETCGHHSHHDEGHQCTHNN